MTQIAVSANSQQIPLSNVRVIDSTTITATVQPQASTPPGTAEIDLYGPSPQPMIAKGTGGVKAMANRRVNTDSPPNGMVLAGQATAEIENISVQAQNVTRGLNLGPERARINISAPNALAAHLTLGGTFQIAVGYKKSDGTFQALPIACSVTNGCLGEASLSGTLDPNALFPDNAVFLYTQQVNNALVLQATHLGTQQLTITPNDRNIKPVNITLSVEKPKGIGAAINVPALVEEFPGGFDSALYLLADQIGIPPQMIKGQVEQEGKFNPKAWRYEPFNADVGDFAYSTIGMTASRGQTRDLRRAALYGSSLRLPTIGDRFDQGNCGTNATLGNVQVMVNGAPSNGISSLSPSSGPPGSQVTITGADFGTSQAAVSGAVTVNGASATVVSWSTTSIVVVVPNYDYATHVDSRKSDPACNGLPPGEAFAQQVMVDSLNSTPVILIPQRDPKTGKALRDQNGKRKTRRLDASDRYVSATDIYDFNDGRLNWSDYASTTATKALEQGTVAFTAQLTLAASYGLLQVTYITAINQQWSGNSDSCSPGSAPKRLAPKDPDNLFDTECNLGHGGGSLGIGTRFTAKNFAMLSSRSPAVADQSNLEALFSNAYQRYNPGMKNNDGTPKYGPAVITKAKSFEPTPTGTIFTTGGQQ